MAHLVHLLTCVIAIYVGLRTLSIWIRTRKLPELAIGILAVLTHIVAAYVGSWRIYRPASHVARARALVGLAAGVHLTAALGLVGTIAIALAFFPPRRYRALIEQAAQPTGA